MGKCTQLVAMQTTDIVTNHIFGRKHKFPLLCALHMVVSKYTLSIAKFADLATFPAITQDGTSRLFSASCKVASGHKNELVSRSHEVPR